MPSLTPTGHETYIYDHTQYNIHSNSPDTREHLGALHNPTKLPLPECDGDTSPLIMVEPSYASGSNDVFIMFRGGKTIILPRNMAEQLRDALVKVCDKKLVSGLTF